MCLKLSLPGFKFQQNADPLHQFFQSHHGTPAEAMPRRQKEKSQNEKEPEKESNPAPMAPEFNLADGNADKETEKLYRARTFVSAVVVLKNYWRGGCNHYTYVPMTVSRPASPRLSDLILGAFANVQPSETLDHLVRYLGTWSGSDKLFMIIQYGVKVIAPLLRLRARLQFRSGLRNCSTSAAAAVCDKFGSILGDSRTLWRFWGLLPTIQWLISLERKPHVTRKLLTIERLQGWSMLAYYGLEHVSYFCSQGLLPSTFLFPFSFKSITLSANKIALWSTRFWAFYIMLQFAHLREDRKLLQLRQRCLRKARGTGLTPAEKYDLRQRWDAYWSDMIANLGYLPLTIHWSLEQGLFQNEAWVGVFGLVAAVASFRHGWRATALPPPWTPPLSPVIRGSRSPEPFQLDNN